MLEKLRASKGAIIFVAAISIFTDTFMYGLVIPVLPYALVQRLGVDPDDVQFWNTTFMASWAAAILVGSILFGWLIGLGLSKKWTFVTAQGILALSTALFMLGRSTAMLTFARVLQGLSGGAISTMAYTLTFDAVGKDQIGSAIGWVATGLSMGVFFGPIVGGPLYDAAGYIWVFIPMIILIVIEMFMRIVLIVPERADKAVADDGERQRLLADSADEARRPSQGRRRRSSVSSSMRRSSLGDPTKLFAKAGTAQRSPFLILLGNRRFLVAMFGLFIGNNFTGAIESTLPVFASRELGFNSTKVALLLLASTFPQFLGPVAGWVVDKIGPKWPTSLGFIVGAISLVFLRFTDYESSYRVPLLVVLLVVYGTSIALFWGPIITEVSLAVEELEEKEPGVFGEHGALSLAFGLQNAAFGAGCMVGPIYAGLLFVKAGWSTMTLVLAIISLLTAIPVFIYTGGSILESKENLKPKASNTNTTA